MVADVDEARVAAVKQRRRSGERMDVIPPKALTSDFSDRQISACFRREEVGCRQAGVQLGSVDALLAQLALSRDLELLTTDRDFENAGAVVPLRVWRPK